MSEDIKKQIEELNKQVDELRMQRKVVIPHARSMISTHRFTRK